MNTLRQAVQEYLSLRRSLGFKLQDAGKGLIDFVTFMERHRTSHITQALALAWAPTAGKRPTRPLGETTEASYAGFARHRSATDPRTQIPAQGLVAFSTKAGAALPVLGR